MAEVYDVLGMRIVVDAAPDCSPSLVDLEAACHEVESIVNSLWPPIPDRRKDYITRPKTNGYQSLHTAVQVPCKSAALEEAGDVCSVEIQIRSAAMHVAAEHGDSAHFAYKGGLDAVQTVRLQEWTQQLMQVLVLPACVLARRCLCGALGFWN